MNPLEASCVWIFHNNFGDFPTAFVVALTFPSSFLAEFPVVLHAIDITNDNNWSKLWIDTDSQFVIKAFSNSFLIHWRLRNRWILCMNLISNNKFFITHIYIEENFYAHFLANVGRTSISLTLFTTSF